MTTELILRQSEVPVERSLLSPLYLDRACAAQLESKRATGLTVSSPPTPLPLIRPFKKLSWPSVLTV